jgi:hypothetical protein
MELQKWQKVLQAALQLLREVRGFSLQNVRYYVCIWNFAVDNRLSIWKVRCNFLTN